MFHCLMCEGGGRLSIQVIFLRKILALQINDSSHALSMDVGEYTSHLPEKDIVLRKILALHINDSSHALSMNVGEC